MTATLNDVVTKKPAEQSAEQQAAAELVRLAKEQGLSLTGPDGLLKQLTRTVLETALNEEMTEHLGYAKHDPAGGRGRQCAQQCPVQDGADGAVALSDRRRCGQDEPVKLSSRSRRLVAVRLSFRGFPVPGRSDRVGGALVSAVRPNKSYRGWQGHTRSGSCR
jgi:putative transposase